MKPSLVVVLAIFLSACDSDQSEQGTKTTLSDNSKQLTSTTVDIARIESIITQRCTTCHSKEPTDDVFRVAPSNVMFDTIEQMQRAAARIHARSVATQTMPFMNKTQMTEEERSLVGEWVEAGAPTK